MPHTNHWSANFWFCFRSFSLSMGTDESLLAKFNKHHSLNQYYEKPPTKEPAFSIIHYAGTVKYRVKVCYVNTELCLQYLLFFFCDIPLSLLRTMLHCDNEIRIADAGQFVTLMECSDNNLEINIVFGTRGA